MMPTPLPMPPALWISESFIDATKGHRFGDNEPYQTSYCSTGALYKALQSEYDRCVSKVYVDTKSGEATAIGWVFEKRLEYEDAYRISDKNERVYTREVWVTVMEPCELDDPAALTRPTRLGEERIRLKHKGL